MTTLLPVGDVADLGMNDWDVEALERDRLAHERPVTDWRERPAVFAFPTTNARRARAQLARMRPGTEVEVTPHGGIITRSPRPQRPVVLADSLTPLEVLRRYHADALGEAEALSALLQGALRSGAAGYAGRGDAAVGQAPLLAPQPASASRDWIALLLWGWSWRAFAVIAGLCILVGATVPYVAAPALWEVGGGLLLTAPMLYARWNLLGALWRLAMATVVLSLGLASPRVFTVALTGAVALCAAEPIAQVWHRRPRRVRLA